MVAVSGLKTLFNTCNTTYKRESLHQQYLADNLHLSSKYVMANDIDLRLITDRIDQCLNEEQQKVFWMNRQGHNTKEIADKINKSEGNTRHILHTAKKKLRQDPLIKEMIG